ncbi:MAG: efflux RND transporter periplasmic adaptor subunit [Betaproteobacteria bacterium]|nr:efflux RND transporter periplasmic adaptor subunit [Betaproteobacteria bacterium]
MPAASETLPAALLNFEQALRGAKSLREVCFVAVNEPAAFLAYDQAVLWRYDALGRISIAAVSGLAEIDVNSPYCLWLARVFDHLKDAAGPAQSVTSANLPAPLAQDWNEWSLQHVTYCGLQAPDGKTLGGLWLAAAAPAEEGSVQLAAWVAQASAFALWAWQRERFDFRKLLPQGLTRRQRQIGAVVLLAVVLFPVRLSALAPAEITPLRPVPITAPVDGVVEKVWVAPNQEVKIGDVLVTLDDTSVRNKLTVAQKSLDIARADLQRATNKAFSDDASKAELQVLDSRMKEKAAEVDYLGELLKRIRLTAPQAGIAIFADADEWTGKPVQTGEKIMTVADSTQVGLTLYLPPDDAIQLAAGGDVSVFLNALPLSALDAKITQTSYETVPTPEGNPAYVIRARFVDADAHPRIGLKGTAKVYAGRVPFVYYVLRKPLLFLRKALGV